MAQIIVVDDEDVFREMLVTQLTRARYSVAEARNGNDGLAKCIEQNPDLVITDIVMPDKEGLELIMDLKKDLPDIKIIAISGGGNLGPECYLPRAHKLGADCTLTKPFSKEVLLEAVKLLVPS